MSEEAKRSRDDSSGTVFTDRDLPPDPKGGTTEELDHAEVEKTARKILRYVKERADEGYIVYRKEMEMITQDTDENIDEAIGRLKKAGEIYESGKNAFRTVLKPARGNAQKKKSSRGREEKGKGKTTKKEGKKMSERLNEFEKKENATEGKAKGKDEGEVYDLTDEDMPTQMFDGERIGMDDILDETIVIRDMVTRPSSFSEGDYIILQVEKDGEPYVVLTGSAVLMRQIKEMADKLSFRCKIIEQQSTRSKYKYYTLAPIATA